MEPLINWLISFWTTVFTVSSYGYVKKFQINTIKSYLTNLFIGFHKGPSGYIQIFDSIQQPQNGDIPMFSKRVTGGTDIKINFGLLGMVFENGIWIMTSSERSSLMQDGLEFFITATYRT